MDTMATMQHALRQAYASSIVDSTQKQLEIMRRFFEPERVKMLRSAAARYRRKSRWHVKTRARAAYRGRAAHFDRMADEIQRRIDARQKTSTYGAMKLTWPV